MKDFDVNAFEADSVLYLLVGSFSSSLALSQLPSEEPFSFKGPPFLLGPSFSVNVHHFYSGAFDNFPVFAGLATFFNY